MDSLDLFHRCIWNIDRDEADARMEAVLAWVGESADPDRVFTQQKLDLWAARNGYTRGVDTNEIVATLKRVYPLLERHSQLFTDVHDLVWKYGGFT